MSVWRILLIIFLSISVTIAWEWFKPTDFDRKIKQTALGNSIGLIMVAYWFIILLIPIALIVALFRFAF